MLITIALNLWIYSITFMIFTEQYASIRCSTYGGKNYITQSSFVTEPATRGFSVIFPKKTLIESITNQAHLSEIGPNVVIGLRHEGVSALL